MSLNVTFILTNWSYVDYNKFLNLFSNRKFREAGHLVEKVVADWSVFETVPEGATHPMNYLPLEDASAIIHALQAKTTEYVESLDVENDIIVDISKWNWDSFNIFQGHVENNRLDKAIEMMLQVARFKKGHPKKGTELNCIQGMALFSALSAKIARVFSGGN